MSISEEALEAMRLFMRETAAANKAIHDAALAFITATAPPKKELEHRSESSPGRVTSPPCQVLVEGLIQEARAFHGAVPTETRQSWLKKIEACKGKIPESEYNEALAILRAGPALASA